MFWKWFKKDKRKFTIVNFLIVVNTIKAKLNFQVQYADDAKFFLLNEEDIKKLCKYSYKKAYNRPLYRENAWDCNTYANAFALDARELFYDYQLEAAPAVFFISHSNHALNIIITETNKIVFIEPQSCKRVMLNDDQIKQIKKINL